MNKMIYIYIISLSSLIFCRLNYSQLYDDQNTWEHQNIPPYELNSVSTVNSSGFVIVGQSIIRSSDGGISWDIPFIKSESTGSYDVAFADSLNGASVSEVIGQILITSDAGKTWEKRNFNFNRFLFSIDFADKNNGFAVGEFGAVVRTTNGGDTWSAGTDLGYVELIGVDFSDSLNGYILGSIYDYSGDGSRYRIFKTKTGGDTWENLILPNSIDGYPIGRPNGLFASDSNKVTIACNEGNVLQTLDGGINWNRRTTNVLWNLNDIYFVNSNIGYAVGNAATIIKSTNGGIDWYAQQTDLSNINLKDIAFLDEMTGVAVGDRSTIITTTNGGQTWNSGYERVTETDLNSLFFTNKTEGIIIGDDGAILKTIDGGNNWQLIPSEVSESLNGVYFTNSSIGLIVGNSGAILRTIDGGENWTKEYIESQYSLFEIEFISKTTGFIVGDNGAIWKTTDTGNTWTLQNIGTNVLLRDVSFFNDSIGCTVGDQGTVLITTNAGGSWTIQNSGIVQDIFGVSFLSEEEIIAIPDRASEILHSYDGGETWIIEQLPGNPIGLNNGQVLSYNSGIVVGKYGRIYNYSNNIWTIQYSCSRLDLNKGFLVDDSASFIVGDKGLILTRKSEGQIPVELISFIADKISNQVSLTWSTATETNNSGFEVEKSLDGKNFNKIAFINGAGTTTEPQSYSFIDNDISKSSKLFYRLKQIDLDGSYEYSKTIEVDLIPQHFSLSQNYPNPFNPTTTIEFSLPSAGHVLLKVYDVLGNEIATLVNEEKEGGFYTINFDAYKYASGVYAYSLSLNGQRITKKMLLQK